MNTFLCHASRTLGLSLTNALQPVKQSPSSFPPGDAHRAIGKHAARMGKSNKFDYTNRPNSGVKLGSIIGQALEKEAEKVKRGAERLAHKARKQSTDSGTGGGFDSAGTTHIIDLKAPMKDLGDDGVAALVKGLKCALKEGTSSASLALEDLNLSGNGLTVSSLFRLAPVIEMAKYDLKTLNLSGNKIKVISDEEAFHWKTFLLAFRGCLKMRRLDLSGNPELGSRGLEVFARLHTKEDPITPLPPGGETSVLSLPFITENEHDGATDSPVQDDDADVDSEFKSFMQDGQLIKRRCGLRSIPFITLQNIGLNDAGALWLSYIIEDHYYPNQLIDELNATHADSTVKAYQQDTSARGIDWSENATLGKEGASLLERTEAIRCETFQDNSSMKASLLMEDEDGVSADDEPVRRSSTERILTAVIVGRRRASVRSVDSEAVELESARKKVQRYIIGHSGAGSVELWRAALKLFWATRLLRFISCKERHEELCFPVSCRSSNTEHNAGIENGTLATLNSASGHKASYASLLTPPVMGKHASPELAMTDVTNTSTTPKKFHKLTHRKGAFSDGINTAALAQKLESLALRSRFQKPRLSDFIQFQEQRLAMNMREHGVHAYRDVSVAHHLPGRLVGEIVGYLIDEADLSVMGEAQRRAAADWGSNKRTMRMETEWLKKDESAQVLMLLDGMRCLAYET